MRRCRWHCVIKLRIVRGGLIVLVSHFSRSQRDNCSIFPLICETPPRAASSTGNEESGGKTKREKERDVYMKVQIHIYVYIYMDVPFVNISILMIWGTEFSVYFSLDALIAHGGSRSKKERDKKEEKSRKGWMDGWRAFIFPGISFFFQKWHIVHENRVESATHARTISERKRRYFTEKCDNEPATGLRTRVISEMMLRAEFSVHLRRKRKALHHSMPHCSSA